MAFRNLPITSRKLFELPTSSIYLLSYGRSLISIFENSGDLRKPFYQNKLLNTNHFKIFPSSPGAPLSQYTIARSGYRYRNVDGTRCPATGVHSSFYTSPLQISFFPLLLYGTNSVRRRQYPLVIPNSIFIVFLVASCTQYI